MIMDRYIPHYVFHIPVYYHASNFGSMLFEIPSGDEIRANMKNVRENPVDMLR